MTSYIDAEQTRIEPPHYLLYIIKYTVNYINIILFQIHSYMAETYYFQYSNKFLNKPETPSIHEILPMRALSPNISFIELKKYKLPELKCIAKHYKLHVSGRKLDLIDRILYHHKQNTSALKIQCLFRGHLVRYSFKLRGKGFDNRSLCTNTYDFYTLEPLETMDFRKYIGLDDDTKHVYGFDITSVIHLFKQNNNFAIQNPYNRETFSFKSIYQLYQLYQICKIIFPNSVDTTLKMPHIRYIRKRVSPIIPQQQNIVVVATSPHEQRLYQLQALQEIKRYPFTTRVQNVFMEMDRLGNYTDPNWFINLEKPGLANFYKSYFELWNFQPEITSEVKRNICALNDPFSKVAILMNYTGTTHDVFREVCLALIECMVFSGIDEEHKKLGALHVLTLLTLVSYPARRQLPWLFESIVT